MDGHKQCYLTFYDVYANVSSVIFAGNSITEIGKEAFSLCKALEGITISGCVTSIDYYVFADCTFLTSVTFEEPFTWYAGSKSTVLTNASDPQAAAEALRSTYVKNNLWRE